MATIILFVLLAAASSHLAAGETENLPSDKASFDTGPGQLMAYGNYCTTPKSIVPDSELKWRVNVHNQSVFLLGEKAEFVCNKGFRQAGWLPTLTCQKNGTWSPSLFDIDKASGSDLRLCITTNCSAAVRRFHCASGHQDVPFCKKCDCIADCVDGSDEMGCGPILINVTGLATGEVNSPKNETHYTGPLNCSRALWTDDAGFYIKLLFTDFSLSGDCGDNYIFLENATFSDTDSPPECCKETKNIFCAFGKQTGPPPLSHTDKNFMIVNYFVSKKSNSSSFSAKWYNVNGFYPYGLIPKDDSGYPEKIKLQRSSSSNVEDDSTDPTYIAATVIFGIVAFVVLAIVACKLGRRFVGPQCSLEYCCAWIAVRRGQRSPRLSPRRGPSPEARPIRGNIQEAHSSGRSQRTVPVDARAAPVSRTRYGSAENA